MSDSEEDTHNVMDGYLEIRITQEFSEATNTPEALVEQIRKVAGVDAAEVPFTAVG